MGYQVKQIKIDFHVTPEIKRYVYVYLIILGKECYLIDSGVYGSESIITKYLKQINKDISDIKGIFLTHAHPDHIGTAAWFKEKTGCMIYASQGEKSWIEDIDLQFKERPIPNFYNLAGTSVKVDRVVSDGDVIQLDEENQIRVVGTAGHSKDEVSYQIGKNLFIGDSVPVMGGIPIYVDKAASLHTLDIIEHMTDIEAFYPAWDKMYDKSEIYKKLEDAKKIIEKIDEAVGAVKRNSKEMDVHAITEKVTEILDMPIMLNNPLFEKTIQSHCINNKI